MSNLYFNYKNEVPPEKGSLLISEPHLPDTNFERTVILLCEHNEEGSFGFVLNKKSRVTLGELLEDQKGLSAPVGIGGPVEQNTLHFLHRSEELEGSRHVTDDIYWGGDFNILLEWLNTSVIQPDEVHFYLGYSGWSAGQLQEEIEHNSWIVYQSKDLKSVLETSDQDMWTSILNEMGGRFTMFSKYPEDPRLN
jgi:putative transcriptional regulator